MEKNKEEVINELVGGDISASGNDRPYSSSQISTRIQKSVDDESNFEPKGQTTTDTIFKRYLTNRSFWSTPNSGIGLRENNKITKEGLELNIENLVKRKNDELVSKIPDKFKKIKDLLNGFDLTSDEINKIIDEIKEKVNL